MFSAQAPTESGPGPSLSAPPTKALKTPTRSISVGKGFAFSALVTVAVLCAWFLLYIFLLTPFEEARSQTIRYSTLRESLALQTAPIGGDISPGTPIALMSSPSLGISAVVVVEGTTSGDLMNGPGHLRNSVLPGQMGTSYIFGRASMFGGPFSGISSAKAGDLITVTTGQGVFTYAVDAVRTVDSPLPQPLTAGKGRLTLITAAGDGLFGAWRPSDAVYVEIGRAHV